MSKQTVKGCCKVYCTTSLAGSTDHGFQHPGTYNWKWLDDLLVVSWTFPHHLGGIPIAIHGFGDRIQVCISLPVLGLFGCWGDSVLLSQLGVSLLDLRCPLLREPMSGSVFPSRWQTDPVQEEACLLGRAKSRFCLPQVGPVVKLCFPLSSSSIA